MKAQLVIQIDDSFKITDLVDIPGILSIRTIMDNEPRVLPAGQRTPTPKKPTKPTGRGGGFNVKAVLTAIKDEPKHYTALERTISIPAGFSSLVRRQEDHGRLTFNRSTRLITITDGGLKHLAEMEAADA